MFKNGSDWYRLLKIVVECQLSLWTRKYDLIVCLQGYTEHWSKIDRNFDGFNGLFVLLTWKLKFLQPRIFIDYFLHKNVILRWFFLFCLLNWAIFQIMAIHKLIKMFWWILTKSYSLNFQIYPKMSFLYKNRLNTSKFKFNQFSGIARI